MFSMPLTELILDFEIQIYTIKNKVVYFNQVVKDEGEFSLKLMDKFNKYNPEFFEKYLSLDGWYF